MREPKNCMARRDLCRHSDQRWEMKTIFWSGPEDQRQWWPEIQPLGQLPQSAEGHVLAAFLTHSVHELIPTQRR